MSEETMTEREEFNCITETIAVYMEQAALEYEHGGEIGKLDTLWSMGAPIDKLSQV